MKKPSKEIEDKILEGLTPKQQEAVKHIDGNLEIVACAGAGKTKTITLRIIYMIASGIKPENIVAITFTKKAAEEMRGRIYAAGEKILGNTIGFASMFIGTIDSFCLKMLQDYVSETYAKFSVLDETQTKVFLELYPNESGLKGSVIDNAENLNTSYDFASKCRYPDEKPVKKYDYYSSLMSILNSCWYDRSYRDKWPESLKNCLVSFNECLRSNNYFDFSGLLREMIELLDPDSDTNNGQESDFAKKIYDRVKYLTIDEYQDTNPAQEHLAELFYAHKTQICVVGDEDQTIYQFRGSDESNIIGFNTRFNAPVIHLDYNFRSTEAVISLGVDSISPKHISDPGYKPMTPPEKSTVSGRALAYEDGDVVRADFDSYDEETDFIVERIKKLKELEIPYSEMAVLFRVRRLLDFGKTVIDYQAELVEKLQREKIPYIVEGLNQLFTTPEYYASKEIFNYLYKKFGLNGYCDKPDRAEKEKECIDKVRSAWMDIRCNLTPDGLDKAVKGLASIDLQGKKFGHLCNMQQIYQDFVSSLSVINDPSQDAERILYNLGKFSRVIADFEQLFFKESPSFKLGRFHMHLEKVADGLYPEGMEDNAYIRTDAVRLMSIHQSKGLEFTAVFVPTMADKHVIPHLMDFDRKPTYVYNAIDALEELGCTFDDPWIPNQRGYDTTVSSERNLLYVAITRAKKYLFLTFSKQTCGDEITKPTRFFEDLGDTFLKNFDPNVNYTADHLPKIEKVSIPVTLNFSVLSNYFDCPYRFKLSNFYGFVQPFTDVQGYGKTMHEIMMHIHRAWIDKKKIDDEWIDKTVRQSMNLPYANSQQIEKAIKGATECAKAYVRQNEKDSDRIEAAEMEINIEMGDGVSVNGRIDLVIRGNGKDKETMIVDLKCAGKDAEQCLNAEQLKIYAIGYKEMTDRDADSLMIYNLDKPDGSGNVKEPVDDKKLDETLDHIKKAAKCIRESDLPKTKGPNCKQCYVYNLCKPS